METGFHSISSIKHYLLSNIMSKNDVCLIFYLKEISQSVMENGTEVRNYSLQRKAIPSYLKEEFYRRHGMGLQVPERDVLAFIKEHKINISEERVDDLIKRTYV